MSKQPNRVGQENPSQYKVAKGPKAKQSGFEVSYEQTTGNDTGKNKYNR